MTEPKRSALDVLGLLAKAREQVKKKKSEIEKSLSDKGLNPDEKKKKQAITITEFRDVDDWILSMILVAVMHANPGVTAEEATVIGKEWVRKLHQPRSGAIWRRQVDRIGRTGVRAAASKIRRELFKMI